MIIEVLICTHNRAGLLERTLDHIDQAACPTDAEGITLILGAVPAPGAGASFGLGTRDGPRCWGFRRTQSGLREAIRTNAVEAG